MKQFLEMRKRIQVLGVFLMCSIFTTSVFSNGPLSHVEYSTYIGGSSHEYYLTYTQGGIEKDNDGNIYILGSSQSTDFPTTPGALQSVNAGGYDCVVSKFDPTLTTLIASTYFGGSSTEYCGDIEIDGNGDVYISMNTASTIPYTSASSFDTTRTSRDTFIAKLDSNLTTVLSSTYFGVNSLEYLTTDMEIAPDGSLYFTSTTNGDFFDNDPLYASQALLGYQSTSGGSYDVFVANIDANLSTLNYLTYLGGSGLDGRNPTVHIDNNGDVVVRSHTNSTDFPMNSSIAGYDITHNGGYDVTLSKLSPKLDTLIGSTYLGGTDNEYYSSINHSNGDLFFDQNNDIYLVGITRSADFPTTAGVINPVYGGGVTDGFITKMSSDLDSVQSSTYIAGPSYDMGSSIVPYQNGDVLVLGSSNAGLLGTSDAYNPSVSGARDNQLMLLDGSLSTLKQHTYVGGTSSDLSFMNDESLLIDGECVYFSSASSSTNFPLSTGSGDIPYQSARAGSFDFTLTKMCPASCGDNVIQEFEGEECDDENTVGGDGCSAICKIERCGDGVILDGEECDDGNETSGDGCSDSCEIEYCRDDAPLNDTSKNFVITDLSSSLIAGTSTQINSELAICFEDTTGTRDIFYTTTDAAGAFSYTPNFAPYASPWVNVGIMLHDDDGLDIDHHALMLVK